MSNFYQEAILDAKAVRASALANAKATLIEEFEPQVSTLVSKQLSEKVEEELDETQMHSSEEEMDGNQLQQEENELDEASLDEILAELESLAGAKKDMNPSYEEESMHETKDQEEIAGHRKAALKTAEKDSAYKIKAKDSIKEDEEEYEAEEELDETKDHEEIAGHKGMKNKSQDDAYKMKAKDHIHEEGEEGEEEGEEENGEGEEAVATDDDTKVIDITLGDLKHVLQSVMAGQHADGETTADDAEIAGGEVSLDEILDELSQMEEAKKEPIAGKKGVAIKATEKETAYKTPVKDSIKEDEEEIEEAKKTIEELRSTLQEVNLLNAKLLFMNKLFRAGKLTESQKMNVVKNLDKAETAKEAEKIYSTLKESFAVKTRSTIKESIGFASQAAGIAPKTNIIEAEPYVTRWQTLAGIKK